jgi:hypothetical protein
MIDLSKKAKISLEKKGVFGEKVNVALVLDISASMTNLFNKGTVQQLVERLLALGMNMDDNKAIDLYLFGVNAHSLGTVTESDIEGFVKNKVSAKYRLEGGTRYAPPMNLIINDFLGTGGKVAKKESSMFGGLFGKKKEKEEISSTVGSTDTTIVFFVTDGDNSDKSETEQLIKKVSDKPVFWQFIGLGNASFGFLKSLDDMPGRVIDNANFFQANDISKITDEQLYDRILTEFPVWLKEAREKGIASSKN